MLASLAGAVFVLRLRRGCLRLRRGNSNDWATVCQHDRGHLHWDCTMRYAATTPPRMRAVRATPVPFEREHVFPYAI